MTNLLTSKKLASALMVATFGFSIRSQGATLPYSTSFETTPGSASQTDSPGNIVGQNNGTGATSEDSNTSSVVVSGMAASGNQSVQVTTHSDGNYADYFNGNLSPNPANTGGSMDVSFALDQASGDTGSGPFGMDILGTNGVSIASLFTIKGTDGSNDLEVTSGGSTASTDGDKLAVVPEPISASMVGVGTMALLLRRPKRLT